MFFENPLFLWLLAGAGLPVLIHLFARRRARQVEFSTLRFLKLSLLKVSRRRSVEEWLILGLRMLLFALIALAVAGPMMTRGFLPGGDHYFVLVLDDSFSMAAGRGGPAWARLQETASGILASARRPTFAAVVFTSGESCPFTLDTGVLGGLVKRHTVSASAGNLLRALEQAAALLEGKPGVNSIYLITDLQKYPWENVRVAAARDKRISLFLIPVGGGGGGNLGIKSVRLVPAGREYACDVTVINWSRDRASAEVLLTGGGPPQTKQVSLDPGAEGSGTFMLTGMPERLEAVLSPPDALDVDNHGYWGRGAASGDRVLLVRETGSEAGFFLERALAVLGGGAETDVKSPSELSALDVEAYRVVIFSDIGRIEPAVARSLETFVRTGGGLVVFPGDRVTADAFNQDWAVPGQDEFLMPARLGARSLPGRVLRVGPAETRHPVFSGMASDAFDYLKNVQFFSVFGLRDQNGDAILRLANGDPLLCERAVGRGRVFLAAFSPTPAWTNLPEKPVFPVLMNMLIRYLTGGGAASVSVGDPFPVRTPAGGPGPLMVSPSGVVTPPAAPGGSTAVTADRPGLWTVRSGGGTG